MLNPYVLASRALAAQNGQPGENTPNGEGGKYVLELPWTRPLLSLNDRPHPLRRAEYVKTMRETAHILAKANNLPRDKTHVIVTLFWLPPDNRRRDAENPIPVLKALCDGLVDYGLVPDDTPDFMTKLMPIIVPRKKGDKARMWLEIVIES